jgi:hypothetical protein
MSMAGRISGYPLLSYLTFVMPILLLALGIIFRANVFLIIMSITWLGVALLVLYLPVADENRA